MECLVIMGNPEIYDEPDYKNEYYSNYMHSK